MEITKNLKVKTTRQMVGENNTVIPVGTELSVRGADFEGEVAMYFLEGVIEADGRTKNTHVLAYKDEFEPLKEI